MKKIMYLVGWNAVKVTEESYTSKASLLDLDPLPAYSNGDEKPPLAASGSSAVSTKHPTDG